MMGIGVFILEIVAPFLEILAPLMPGDIFPYFFKLEMFQRAFLASIMAVSYTHLTLPTICSV